MEAAVQLVEKMSVEIDAGQVNFPGSYSTTLPRMPWPEINLFRLISTQTTDTVNIHTGKYYYCIRLVCKLFSPEPISQDLSKLGQRKVLSHSVRFLLQDLVKVDQVVALMYSHIVFCYYSEVQVLSLLGFLLSLPSFDFTVGTALLTLLIV